MKKFAFATALYLVITMILGYTWHLIVFKELYHELGIYNREPPIIPLGFTSMLVQGVVLAYLYPRFYQGGAPIWQGVKFGLVMGLFLFSVSTLANAAKIQVTSMSTWLIIQTAFHLIQFLIVGAGIGAVYGECSGETKHGI